MSNAAPLASASSSSRFVTESSILEAQERRKEEWKKAYERLGQKAPEGEGPPPEKYDPRPLHEKLQEQRDNKQAEFDDKYSIRNQFRSLNDEEVSFLESTFDEKRQAEMERQNEIDSELAKFREAVNAKQAIPDALSATSPPLPGASASTSATSPPATATTTKAPLPPPKKKTGPTQKGLLAGAIKRKSLGGEKEKKKPKLASPNETKKDKEKEKESISKEGQ